MQYCTGYTETCDVCMLMSYEISDIINTGISGLISGNTYYLWVADKFGNQYVNSFVADAGGQVFIDISQYPNGIFTNVSGTFDLCISLDSIGTQIVQYTFNNVIYNCIIFSITCPLNYMLLEDQEYYLFEDNENWSLE